jgi:uncharacterized oxidoreductase
MHITGNTILITGGASGIGLGLTKRFLEAGNEVIICGRRPDKLMEVKERCPGVHTKVCDIADELSRRELYNWVAGTFPAVNVLINNAGIQQRMKILDTGLEWSYCHQEIAANLEAPIHLSMLFIKHFIRKPQASIINVTSGLAFIQPGWVPIYGATKAALHSFTVSLRLQLSNSNTNIEVVEIVPPVVNTDLGGINLHTEGIAVDDFIQAVFDCFRKGDKEIAVGTSINISRASRDVLDNITQQAWEHNKE